MSQTTSTRGDRTATGSKATWKFALRVKQLRQHPFALRRRAVDTALHNALHNKILQTLRDVRLHTSVGGTVLVSKQCNWRKITSNRGSQKKERSLSQVYWKAENGMLCSTLSMSQFSALKAATPLIKVTLYGICKSDQPTNVKIPLEITIQLGQNEEAISLGYFFIDLRTPNVSATWSRLLNASISGEVLFETSFSPLESKESIIMSASPLPRPYTDVELHPQVNKESNEACLQLGRNNGQDVFIISIKIREATNLHSIISDQKPSTALREYWLSYSFFDLVIQTDTFFDLKVPSFPSIKDNFRIRSSLNDLREFLRHQKLVIYLCTENQVLGDVQTSFSGLLSQPIFSSDKNEASNSALLQDCLVFDQSAQPIPHVNVEICVLREKTTNKGSQGATQLSGNLREDMKDNEYKAEREDTRIPDSTEAIDGAPKHIDGTSHLRIQHLCLKKSVLKMFTELSAGGLELEARLAAEKAVGSIDWLAVTHEHYYGSISRVSLPIPQMKDVVLNVQIALNGTADTGERVENVANLVVPICDTRSTNALLNLRNEQIGSCSLQLYKAEWNEILVENEEESDLVHRSDIKESQMGHRFHLFIEFEAIQLGLDPSSSIVFDLRNPLLNIDKVQVEANTERASPKKSILSNTYCKYAFAAPIEKLPELMKEQLTITILDRKAFESNGDGDQCTMKIGEAIFSLNYLFFAREFYCCSATDCDMTFASQEDAEHHQCESNPGISIHGFKSCNLNLPIVTNILGTYGQKEVGNLDIVAYIEDCGAVNLISQNVQVQRFFSEHTKRTLPLEQSYVPTMGTEESEPQKTTHEEQECKTPVKQAHDRVKETHPVTSQRMHHALVDVPPAHSVPQIFSPPHQKSLEVKAKLNELDELKQYLLDEHDRLVQKQARIEAEHKQKLLENEKNRIKVLEEEWAKKEVERNTIVHDTQKEYLKLERQLRASLTELEAKKRQFDTEKAEHERKCQSERNEIDLLRKQLYVERQNAESLDKQRTMTLKKQIASLNAQLSASEKKNKRLEAEFVEFQEQQCNITKAKLREELFSLRGTIQALEKEKKFMSEAHNTTKLKLTAMQKQLDNLVKLLEVEKIKSQTKALDELENMKLSCTAKEEKAVLAYEGEELRDIKSQLEQIRQVAAMRKNHRLCIPEGHFDDSKPRVKVKSRSRTKNLHKLEDKQAFESDLSGDEDPATTSTGQKTKALIQRLRQERAFLLSCGQYDRNSELVKELDRLLHVTIESGRSKTSS